MNKQPIRVVALVIKRGDPHSRVLARGLAEWLHSAGLEVLAEPEEAAALAAVALEKPAMARRAELVVVLGGDGTLLSIARYADERQVPILGINLGGLGFLTQASVGEARAAIERVLEGHYEIDSRITLETTVIHRRDGSVEEREFPPALNDVVIHKQQLGRLLRLSVTANRQDFCTYHADGLIVATPTGSTAYALSAGGPIILPTLEVVVLAPICPHTLSNRPVVLPDSYPLEVAVENGDSRDATVSIDGQDAIELGRTDRVRIRKGRTRVALVHSAHSYFEIWRNKLKWG